MCHIDTIRPHPGRSVAFNPTPPGDDLLNPKEPQSQTEILASFLGVSAGRITQSTGRLYGYHAYYCDGIQAYLVLSEEEAEQAAQKAISERVWVIALESIFEYFGIDAYPSDAIEAIGKEPLFHVNDELRAIINRTCGMETLTSRMLELGNRPNILADYDQREHRYKNFCIYRLF
ncbi:hypothetical protein [Methanogenium organophilum]|uniref:Uncharacterized protein n=1 Tax=Methanogenium organophilum TaxID=2199 RepID=A0A9X9T6T8_METOG|nr:hypothetical protein [Methanogenium organophilum]WAI00354.1 hypothetical protein OU421_07895 [Methanogenium organophilum]